jgi:hypothetical protein
MKEEKPRAVRHFAARSSGLNIVCSEFTLAVFITTNNIKKKKKKKEKDKMKRKTLGATSVARADKNEKNVLEVLSDDGNIARSRETKWNTFGSSGPSVNKNH